MKTKTWAAPVAALALQAFAALAAGCGDDERPASSSGNATDAAFINDMTAHHEGAIEMARIARVRAEHTEVRKLADGIVVAQEGEMAEMKAIRDDMHDVEEHGDGHMGMSEADMGMDMDPAELKEAKPFDRAFIDAMVLHHEGAVAMAEELLEKGDQPALRKMARDIIDAQTREIAQMHEWRKEWYGTSGATHGSGEATHGDG